MKVKKMPRRRRRSSSSDIQMDDDDDSLNNDSEFGSNKCPPQQRNAANARERARMRVLSKAFSRLKTTIPWVPADTKLSKLDTLRLASGYIAHLRALLTDRPTEEPSNGMPLNLTWPFNFQHPIHGSWSSECLTSERSSSPRLQLQPSEEVHHQYFPQSHQNTQEMYNFQPNNFYNRPESNFHQQQNENYYEQIQRENNGNTYGVVYND